LTQVEFAYNNSTNQATGKYPFEVAYGTRPHSPLDLTPSSDKHQFSTDAKSRAKEIKKLHEQVRQRIIKQNSRYKTNRDKHKRHQIFKVGDLVWIHLRKERFPKQPNAKLSPRADGPFKIVQKINDNAYKVELPGTYGVSTTFNVVDLSPYLDDEPDINSRASSVQPGEDDTEQDINMADFGVREWILSWFLSQ